MIEIKGNLWHQTDADAICITTNGSINSKGKAIMGAGIAKQAKQRIPQFPETLAASLNTRGNITFPHFVMNNQVILSFPTKPGDTVFNGDHSLLVPHMRHKAFPGATLQGWMYLSTLDIIEASALQLEDLTTIYKWKKVIIPQPGCSNGGLHWPDVKHVLDSILDDRFYCITY